MERLPLVSVIMPVHNAGTLLHTAVHSVLRQTMPDFELILVDDGSSDGSAALCRALDAANACVRAICQPNAGICAARNRGMDAMRGTWFTFCDDDDAMEPDALETLVNLARAQKADVARADYRLLRLNAAGTPVELPHPPGRAQTIRRPAGEDYLDFLRTSGPQFVWNALYRTDSVGHLRFDERCRHGLEDFVFNAAAYRLIACAAYTPRVTYEHIERHTGASACANPAAVRGRLDSLPVWIEAERAAAAAWCSPETLRCVWDVRQAEFITFVMHQLRDSRLQREECAAVWRMVRCALREGPHSGSDVWHAMCCSCKQGMALLLFRTHLQGAYALLPNREEKLLR